MSAALHLAGPDDLDRLEPMVAAYHAHEGIDTTKEQRRTALAPILDGSLPFGVAYLIGPRRSPVGYIVVSFGYSVELGGIDGFVDEFFIRESVRGRGMGTEVLGKLLPALSQNGVRALHLEVARDNDAAQRLYTRAGFRMRDRYALMTRVD
jgi:ribosomal protein S18 acetylase RimI-like enzyme